MDRHFLLSASLLAAFLALVSIPWAYAGDALGVANLRTEYRANPLGIDVLQPRFSWELASAERNVLQAAYQIRVALSESDLQQNRLVWDSGRVSSPASNQVVYAGPSLQTMQRYHWQIQVWDNRDRASGWSKSARFEMGLLRDSDWQAEWITPDWSEDTAKSGPSPYLRRTFRVEKEIADARIYATAMGLYELELNGARVGDQYFAPGWTAYDFRYQYQTYDVTGGIRKGENCLGAILGDGWFRGYLVGGGTRNRYGDKLGLLAQLVITYADGAREVIATDGRWRAATGPILASDIYNGEIYDARRELRGWSLPGYDGKSWKGVKKIAPPKESVRLVAESGPPVKRIEEIKPVKLEKAPSGEYLLDMGQNMVGWLRFQVRASAGTKITLRHAEVLDKSGELYTANLRSAKQEITFIAGGGNMRVFEPHFTFQGFRYVGIRGWPGKPKLDDFAGIVVHSDIPRTGEFECSEPLINQLQHNIVWGQKGNFVDVPTDCPQRDERLGWTGDAQVFSPTAAFLHDVAGFYTKWLQDLALDQFDDGAVPDVIPNAISHKKRAANAAAAGWADAAVMVPWQVYLAYGDRRILERQYDSMKAWVEYMRRAAGNRYIWNTGRAYGDWLAFATTQSDYPGATTDKDLIKTAYYARSTQILAQTASLLNKTEDAAAYEGLLAKIKAAFQEEFVTPGARISPNTQTAYALALAFDLLPDSMRATAAKRLDEDVRQFKHITTGFLGTPLICAVLTEYGYLEDAFMLLNRKEYPSWLFPVTKGATTIWERWDGIRADGTFQDKGMNSFNHYAYGAIGDWLYGTVAGIGIDPRQPGYRHIVIHPHPGGGLTHAKAAVHSMYGRVSSAWSLKDGMMKIDVEIPPNATATLRLPGAALKDVTESGQALQPQGGIMSFIQAGDAAQIELGSGKYAFAYPFIPAAKPKSN